MFESGETISFAQGTSISAATDSSPKAKGSMRALLIADIDPELGQPLPNYIAAHDVDVLITAGDLNAGLLQGADQLRIPKIGVYGNHCNGRYLEELGITNLQGKKVTIGGLSFVGLQGCIRYKPDDVRFLYTQEEYEQIVAELPPADVLVTHCPPRGINDHEDRAHVGITALRSWIEQHRPALVIHGHTYPDEPVTRYGATEIAYVYGSRLLDLPSPAVHPQSPQTCSPSASITG